jgi:hypothetical protein
MARRKSAAEVGPLSVWAYDTRDALDLSVEAVVAALPTTYHPATLRKVEGGSARPGTRMWRELGWLYTERAAERGIDIEPQPRLGPEQPEPTPNEISELAASIRDLARAIQEERAERLEWERGVLESVSSLARWLGQRDDPEPATRAVGPGTG